LKSAETETQRHILVPYISRGPDRHSRHRLRGVYHCAMNMGQVSTSPGT
jgi:hypothetical protein